MRIHIISTINGQTNEGMRNIATHLAAAMAKQHEVMHSGLRSVFSMLRHSLRADVTLVFARANARVYRLMQLLTRLCGKVWLVCVQPPTEDFLALNDRRPLRCHYLYLLPEDVKRVRMAEGYRRYAFQPGIDAGKFMPVDAPAQALLKQKYGLSPEKPAVVHVGHCSTGRGLEAFLALDGACYERLIVASGMFEDAEVARKLEAGGVRILRGYQEHIEEIYQLADVYLFPTNTVQYVISIPLSVMEALSCGTPVLGRRRFDHLAQIPCEEGAVGLFDGVDELNAAAQAFLEHKGPRSLLQDAISWPDSASAILRILEGANE